jgi:hypothetical protein
VAKPDLFSRDVRLLRKKYVPGFYFGHNIRVLLDFPTMDGFASDHLTDLEDARGGALEADGCVSWLHVALKPIEFLAALHDLSLRLRRLRVGVLPHMRYAPGQSGSLLRVKGGVKPYHCGGVKAGQ